MSRVSERSSNIDKAIGNKIHEERVSRGLSRQQLAGKIGVSHQQLQKYEKGTNRLCPSRLVAIAEAFKKPITWFFESIHSEQQPMPTAHQRLTIEVSRNFLRIKSVKSQDAISALVKSMAEDESCQ